MENPPLQSPTNPHFFKPLLPGFGSFLTIPDAFFSKYIDGKRELKTAKLRSDASDKTWEVEMDGGRFTRGWIDFASAHDFRIGDIIVFKQEGNMEFLATPFGPSCCEIHYTKFDRKDKEDNRDDDNKIRQVSRKNNQRPKTESQSCLSYNCCFVAEVTASNLQTDTFYFPKSASSSNALNRGFLEVILVNEEGKSWTLDLKVRKSIESYYIRGGWTRFCHENRIKLGDLIAFNLVGDGKSTPLLCICPEEECSELINTYKRRNKKKGKRCWVPSSSSRLNRIVTISLRAYNIKNSKLILPVEFTKINGLTKHKKIILMDKHGEKQLINLVQDGPNRGRRGLGKGWKIFCKANDVLKIGEPFVLELIWEDSVPVLKFCYKIKNKPICV